MCTSLLVNDVKKLLNESFFVEFPLQKTLDENPILDRHPIYSNVIFGAGFSGKNMLTTEFRATYKHSHLCVLYWEKGTKLERKTTHLPVHTHGFPG